MSPRFLQPEGWPRPSGYANGVSASGRTIFVAGQIGWDTERRLAPGDFVEQARQALQNIIAILNEDGAGPEHLVRLTWYVTDRAQYLNAAKPLGAVYREVMGKNYPAMTAVQVVGLMESDALVEIEATAVVP